jgi:homoserine kinase
MVFVTSPLTVRVPATCANLGPGFDSLGLAVGLYDTVTARVAGDGVHVSIAGEGAGELPADERHLIAATMLDVFGRLGTRPGGLELSCENAIPQARGLGSSSAAIVAGILLARQLAGAGPGLLDEAAVIRLAAEIEGHPDNVAPCVLGGFTIAWTGAAAGHGGARALRLDDAKGVLPVIFVPAQRGYTAQARAVLPATVPLTDAAFNAARTALLVRALTGTPEMLFEATEDRLHQEYRAAAMPGTARLVADLRQRRVAAVISGAGPSVLALVPDDQQLADEARSRCPDGWYARSLTVAADGARLAGDEAGADKQASPPRGRASGSGLQDCLGLGGVLGAAVVGDLAVPEREEMVQVHRRGLAGAAGPGPEPDDGMHVGVVGGEGDRREFLDLHGRAERGEELRDGVLAVPHAVPGRGGGTGLGGPVDVVGHGVEDGGHITAAECLVYLRNGLDLVVGAHGELPSGPRVSTGPAR